VSRLAPACRTASGGGVAAVRREGPLYLHALGFTPRGTRRPRAPGGRASRASLIQAVHGGHRQVLEFLARSVSAPEDEPRYQRRRDEDLGPLEPDLDEPEAARVGQDESLRVPPADVRHRRIEVQALEALAGRSQTAALFQRGVMRCGTAATRGRSSASGDSAIAGRIDTGTRPRGPLRVSELTSRGARVRRRRRPPAAGLVAESSCHPGRGRRPAACEPPRQSCRTHAGTCPCRVRPSRSAGRGP
jgi:hypothetical protein